MSLMSEAARKLRGSGEVPFNPTYKKLGNKRRELVRKSFGLLSIVLACLSIVYIVSCGTRENDDEIMPVGLVSAAPPDGSTLDVNGIITVIFSDIPGNVSVNVGIVKRAETTITISGPFNPGPLTLTITWEDGAQTLTYTCLLYTSPSPRDLSTSRMPSSA